MPESGIAEPNSGAKREYWDARRRCARARGERPQPRRGLVESEACAIAGSFLASRAGSGVFDAWAVLATLSFALCFASATWVLIPRELVFAFGGDALGRC